MLLDFMYVFWVLIELDELSPEQIVYESPELCM